MSGLDDGTWRCMIDAPKDGTEIELLLRHVNYRYSKTDEERAEWEQAVRSTWIDFNGGGWTWHGMAGSIVGWRPLPSNDQASGARSVPLDAPVGRGKD